jgi:histidyl-tRNA synthetase
MGDEEIKNQTLQIKDLTTGEQEEIAESDLVKHFVV